MSNTRTKRTPDQQLAELLAKLKRIKEKIRKRDARANMQTHMINALPNRIRDFRKQASLTMRQLSKAVGVAESTISRIERGQRQVNPSLLREIAIKLGVRVEELLVHTRTLAHIRDQPNAEEQRIRKGSKYAEHKYRLSQ